MPVVSINFTIEDSDLDKFTVAFYRVFGYPDDLSTWDSEVQGLWDVVRPLIDGVLARAYTTIDHEVNFWTNNIVDVLSDNQERARFVFRNSLASNQITLPTFKEALFTNAGAGKTVDITDSDVQAFVTYVTLAGGLGFMDSHGTITEDLVKAVQAWGH